MSITRIVLSITRFVFYAEEFTVAYCSIPTIHTLNDSNVYSSMVAKTVYVVGQFCLNGEKTSSKVWGQYLACSAQVPIKNGTLAVYTCNCTFVSRLKQTISKECIITALIIQFRVFRRIPLIV